MFKKLASALLIALVLSGCRNPLDTSGSGHTPEPPQEEPGNPIIDNDGNIARVTSSADSGPGSLRQVIIDAAEGSVIVISRNTADIKLKSRIVISKKLTIEGNGITITPDIELMESPGSQLLYTRANAKLVISRVHFRDGRASENGAAIYNDGGELLLQSCIFSENITSDPAARGGAVYNSGIMTIKGCTFYGNSAGNSGGAVFNTAALALEGNLFYGNSGIYSSVIGNIEGTVISNGYNVVDRVLGTEANQSGWNEAAGDKTINDPAVGPVSFKPLSNRGAQHVMDVLPQGYPVFDFYGTRLRNQAAAGAVQTAADGYLLDLSVNNRGMGSVSVTPPLDADGLGISLTLTADPSAICIFSYWLMDGETILNDNPLVLELRDHTAIEAIFTQPAKKEDLIKHAEFTDQTAVINFNNLGNSDIYLVKINKSADAVIASNTGTVRDLFMGLLNSETLYPPGQNLAPMGHPAAREFSANPPPIIDEGLPRLRALPVPPVVGDTRNFWVEEYYNNGVFVEKQATLRASGQYGNIWVMDECYSPSGGTKKVTGAAAELLAEKFDIIYPAETNILGYEYGGGPDGDGGRDGDLKIQILIHDIVDASGTVRAAGYFWAKDYYPQSQLASQKTNYAEIFYIDASQLCNYPDYVYSVLIHEFQHMINFNMKSVKYGINSASWYNEMLSMMAEDILASYINISRTNSLSIIQQRIPQFLKSYTELGITEWNSSSASYAKGYAFGAYLLRNYGAAELMQKILANNAVNIDSITRALNEISEGPDFEQALTRFGEALIYSGSQIPEDILTFGKTVTSTINDFTYTVPAFDIWNDFSKKGPDVFDLAPMAMRPLSLTIHSSDEWKNISGDFSITLNEPADSNIEIFLMAKQGKKP